MVNRETYPARGLMRLSDVREMETTADAELSIVDACELACDINGNHGDRIVVLAVGRFLPPESVTPSMPWGVSVHDWKTNKRSVIRSRAEWEAIIGAEKPAPEASAPPPIEPAKQAGEPCQQQTLLFGDE